MFSLDLCGSSSGTLTSPTVLCTVRKHSARPWEWVWIVSLSIRPCGNKPLPAVIGSRTQSTDSGTNDIVFYSECRRSCVKMDACIQTRISFNWFESVSNFADNCCRLCCSGQNHKQSQCNWTNSCDVLQDWLDDISWNGTFTYSAIY